MLHMTWPHWAWLALGLGLFAVNYVLDITGVQAEVGEREPENGNQRTKGARLDCRVSDGPSPAVRVGTVGGKRSSRTLTGGFSPLSV